MTPARAFFTMGGSPFFMTSAGAYFIKKIPRTPHAFAHQDMEVYNITSKPSFFVPGFRPPPLGYALCRPHICGLGSFFLRFEGLTPLAIGMPPRHPAGLSSCRGKAAGCISLHSRGEVAEAAHAAEISLNHVVMKFHRSDFTDDTVGVFSEQSDDLEPFRLPRTAREIHEPRKG